MRFYELTEDADSDLAEIIRYTIRQWGKNRPVYMRITYTGALKNRRKENRLPPIFKKISQCPRYALQASSYLLFACRKPPRIFAVLHERMDMIVRLKDIFE